METEFNRAVAATDFERSISCYSDVASLFFANRPIVTGKEAIRRYWTKSLAAPGFSLAFQTVKVLDRT